MKPKIALVVQRYGLEVNGGAELHCRLIAERLVNFYDVEILTTCAIDYMTWKDEYQPGTSEINGVKVHRFHSEPRHVDEFNQFSAKLFQKPHRTWSEEHEWIVKQGPQSDDLLSFLKKNQGMYEVVFFFTYSYYTTYVGLQLVPEKSVLIPEAHNEPHVYLSVYKPIFHLPNWILYNTSEEMEFIHQLVSNESVPSQIVGAGVDFVTNRDPKRFREKFDLGDERFLLYVGRIDESKGCGEMFDYLQRFNKEAEYPIRLVLLGKPYMEIPNDPNIVAVGFVSEEEKWDALEAADLLLMPSQYESLSFVVLESLAVTKPVLVNGRCEVLKGHCVKSNAGLYYTNYYEFKECLNYMLQHRSVTEQMGRNGEEYIRENNKWDVIMGKYRDVIESMRSHK